MSIESLGFKKADMSVMHRLIVNVMAREKSGKTHFALTAPGPIVLFNFDFGLEGVINKFNKKPIYASEYRINEISPDKYAAEWERFKRENKAAMNEKQVRTIIWDTGTEVWELIRMARFGKLTQVMPHQYGPVNSEMRTLVRDAYSSDKNLIVLHKMGIQYVNNNPTDKYVMAGFKDIPYNVQVNCLAWREDGGGDFHLEISDCRQNSDMAGLDMVGDMINFQNLAMMVLPGTSEKDWR